MNREFTSNFYKLSIAATGAIGFVLALLYLPAGVLSWHFSLLAVFTILIAPRMSITLPRSKFILSFSDSTVFLTFLFFGGEAAILVAAVEMLAHCLYFKFKGVEFSRYTVLFNVGSATLATTISYHVWVSLPAFFGINPNSPLTSNLVGTLGVLSLTQFLSSSVFAAIFYALKQKIGFWQAWRKESLPISITHFAGAILAGLIFKLLNYGDPYSIGISVIAFAVIYYNYRQIIKEMTNSIEQAEQAERDKADAERDRRIEIEKYAEELKASLRKEEENGHALRKSQHESRHAALHDSLTGLPNRAFFAEIVKEIIADIKAGTAEKSYVLFLDLARFKYINDSLGHGIGDKVLILVAKRFKRLLRASDRVARLGGDEFAIILRGLSSVEKAEKVAWKLHQAVSKPVTLSGNRINLGVNIGVAPVGFEYETPEDILRDADIAMHHAKEKGFGVAVFNTELRQTFMEQAILEAELPFAIERGEFSMHYQPVISLEDGSLTGFEALLRWHHRENIFISPAQFIPIAESTGLIIPITRWILKETCRQLAAWQKMSYANENLMVSVNISGKHLSNNSLIDDVRKALKSSGLAPSALKLEITESAAMENALESVQILTSLKELGVQLSIDDFGTGYSSLSYLHRLPFDTLKIDRSFVKSVGDAGEDSEILQTIVSLAKNLKMRVIAEGIETESQLNILKNLGCDYGQGYLMSKPLPAASMEDLLHQKQYWLPEPKRLEEAPQQTSKAANENLAAVS